MSELDAAWQIVDELRSFKHRLRLKLSESEGRTGSSWAAVFRSSDGRKFVGQAGTPHEAIYLAAKNYRDAALIPADGMTREGPI